MTYEPRFTLIFVASLNVHHSPQALAVIKRSFPLGNAAEHGRPQYKGIIGSTKPN